MKGQPIPCHQSSTSVFLNYHSTHRPIPIKSSYNNSSPPINVTMKLFAVFTTLVMAIAVTAKGSPGSPCYQIKKDGTCVPFPHKRSLGLTNFATRWTKVEFPPQVKEDTN
ncbi:hypothetical protein NX059_007158 [Plenodomus lindquistii]|nr:hypothetical protein NX059_007158 [Plenodomus lindquistii]